MDNEDKLLIQEYCYIRNKQEHKAPDVKKAWDQFEHEHIMKKQSLKTKRHVMFLRYAAAIAIILVMVMGGIGIWWSEGGKLVVENYNTRKYIEMRKAKGKEKLVAFESTKGPQKILIMDEKSINPTKRTTKKTEKVDTLHHKVFLATDILDVAFRKIITPRGKTFEVTLSDGTQVALNADSKFTFPANFAGKPERIVQLEGEAFFKVAKDAKHPFVVVTPSIITTVLGTEFVVKAYADGNPQVTLLSGSVKVNKIGATSAQSVILTPKQQLHLTSDTHTMSVLNVGDQAFLSLKWKDDMFSFYHTPLMEAIQEMGRWYNVGVEISDNSLIKETITLEISRKVSLEDFVNSINLTNNLSAILDQGKIIICPKSACQGINCFTIYAAQDVRN